MTRFAEDRAFRRVRLAPLLAVLLLCLPARTMQADGPAGLTESQIKAGFIFNFLRFVNATDSFLADLGCERTLAGHRLLPCGCG